MEQHNSHTMDTQHQMSQIEKSDFPSANKDHKSNLMLAISATAHCLIGCGLGEVLGMIIGNALNMNMIDTTILSVVLGFVAATLLAAFLAAASFLALARAAFCAGVNLSLAALAASLAAFLINCNDIGISPSYHLTLCDQYFADSLLVGLPCAL